MGMADFTKGQRIKIKMGGEQRVGKFVGYSYSLGPLYSLILLDGEKRIRTVASAYVRKEVKDGEGR